MAARQPFSLTTACHWSNELSTLERRRRDSVLHSVVDENNKGDLTQISTSFDCNSNPFFGPAEFTQHAFRWRKEKLKDLGTLPGGYNSTAGAVNESGTIVGLSENGVIDPLTGYPQAFGVLWSHGRIHNRGALLEEIKVSRLQSTIVAKSLALRRMTSPIASARSVGPKHMPFYGNAALCAI
jgi:hypothetical protein